MSIEICCSIYMLLEVSTSTNNFYQSVVRTNEDRGVSIVRRCEIRAKTTRKSRTKKGVHRVILIGTIQYMESAYRGIVHLYSVHAVPAVRSSDGHDPSAQHAHPGLGAT